MVGPRPWKSAPLMGPLIVHFSNLVQEKEMCSKCKYITFFKPKAGSSGRSVSLTYIVKMGEIKNAGKLGFHCDLLH